MSLLLLFWLLDTGMGPLWGSTTRNNSITSRRTPKGTEGRRRAGPERERQQQVDAR